MRWEVCEVSEVYPKNKNQTLRMWGIIDNLSINKILLVDDS